MDCERRRRRRRRHAAGAAGPPPPPRVLGAAEEMVLLNQGVLVKWAEEGKGIQPRRVEHGSPGSPASVLLCSPLFSSFLLSSQAAAVSSDEGVTGLKHRVAVIGEHGVTRRWLKHGPESADDKGGD